jgi:hypothetical protein
VYDVRGQLRARFSSVGPSRFDLANDTTEAGPVCVRWRDRSETEPTSCLVFSASADAGSKVLLGQLIEFGPELANNPVAATVEDLRLTIDGLAFELTQGARSRRFRIELVPLPVGPLRWP